MAGGDWDHYCEGCGRWPVRPLTVDALVIRDGQILLIERSHDPHVGKYALPGGVVDIDEDGRTAALRELEEETGLVGSNARLLVVADSPERDPDRHAVALVYAVEVAADAVPVAASDAATVKWFGLDELPPLAFDHADLIRSGRAELARLSAEGA